MFIEKIEGIVGGYMNYLILVNKANLFNKEMLGEIVLAGKDFHMKDVYLEKNTCEAVLKILNDVNAIPGFNKVILDSGYRSLEYQQQVFDYYVDRDGIDEAKKRVALVGTSEHHTGLAVDFALNVNGEYLDELSGNEQELIWLADKAYKYGFILRYPKGKESITGYNYEPWHFRYVGSKEIALDLKNRNLTLEEYLDGNLN